VRLLLAWAEGPALRSLGSARCLTSDLAASGGRRRSADETPHHGSTPPSMT